MRLKITAKRGEGIFIPFDYQYRLHAAIYHLIARSSAEYAGFLHNTKGDNLR